MIRASILVTLAVTCSVLLPAGAASAQGVRYYLRQGSMHQSGCFEGCRCALWLQEPLAGAFILTPTTSVPGFVNYTVTDADFRATTFNQNWLGAGTFQVGGDPAALQRMELNLSINGDPARHWDSLPMSIGAASPAIHTVLTINQYQCFDIVLTLRATPFRSDWNASGAITTQDIFAFLGGWFAGDADANGDGLTNQQDLFAFLNDWFART